jgi:hypothetical protein
VLPRLKSADVPLYKFCHIRRSRRRSRDATSQSSLRLRLAASVELRRIRAAALHHHRTHELCHHITIMRRHPRTATLLSPPHYHAASSPRCRAASPPHGAVSPPHSCAAVLLPLRSDCRASPINATPPRSRLVVLVLRRNHPRRAAAKLRCSDTALSALRSCGRCSAITVLSQRCAVAQWSR